MSTVRVLAWQPLRRPLAQILEWRDQVTGEPTSVAWPPPEPSPIPTTE